MAIYVQFVSPLIDRHYNFHGPQAFLNRLLSHSCNSATCPVSNVSNTAKGYFVWAIKIELRVWPVSDCGQEGRSG